MTTTQLVLTNLLNAVKAEALIQISSGFCSTTRIKDICTFTPGSVTFN